MANALRAERKCVAMLAAVLTGERMNVGNISGQHSLTLLERALQPGMKPE